MTWQIPCQGLTQKWTGAPNDGLVNGMLTWKISVCWGVWVSELSGNGLPANSFLGISGEILISGKSVGFLPLPMIRSVRYPWPRGRSSKGPLCILPTSTRAHPDTLRTSQNPRCRRGLLPTEAPGTQVTDLTSPCIPPGGSQGHRCWLLSPLARASGVAGGGRVKPFRWGRLRLCA